MTKRRDVSTNGRLARLQVGIDVALTLFDPGKTWSTQSGLGRPYFSFTCACLSDLFLLDLLNLS